MLSSNNGSAVEYLERKCHQQLRTAIRACHASRLSFSSGSQMHETLQDATPPSHPSSSCSDPVELMHASSLFHSSSNNSSSGGHGCVVRQRRASFSCDGRSPSDDSTGPASSSSSSSTRLRIDAIRRCRFDGAAAAAPAPAPAALLKQPASFATAASTLSPAALPPSAPAPSLPPAARTAAAAAAAVAANRTLRQQLPPNQRACLAGGRPAGTAASGGVADGGALQSQGCWPGAQAVSLYKASLGAHQLERALLAARHAGGGRPTLLVAPDGLLCLMEFGYLELLTLDASTADLMGMLEMDIYLLHPQCRVLTLQRRSAKPGSPWTLVGQSSSSIAVLNELLHECQPVHDGPSVQGVDCAAAAAPLHRSAAAAITAVTAHKPPPLAAPPAHKRCVPSSVLPPKSTCRLSLSNPVGHRPPGSASLC